MNKPVSVAASVPVMPTIHAVCERDNVAALRLAPSIHVLRACTRTALALRIRTPRARAVALLATCRRASSARARAFLAWRRHHATTLAAVAPTHDPGAPPEAPRVTLSETEAAAWLEWRKTGTEETP